jgi:hypothetical protein
VTVAPCTLYTRLRDHYFTFGGYLLDSTVAAGLLKLKARLEAWRGTRKYARQPIPDEFRQAAAGMTERHPLSLVRHILKLDPWRMKVSFRRANATIPKTSELFCQSAFHIDLSFIEAV